MESLFLIGVLNEKGELVVEASPRLTEIAKLGGGRLNVNITPFERTVSKQFRNWYKGILLGYLAEAEFRINGNKHTEAEIDLINKQHAAGTAFRIVSVGETTAIVFDDLSLSKMTKTKSQWFMERLREYWGERGIEIPEPQYPDMKKNDYNNL